MDCVVIGGHAINAHGLDRHTGDLDLIVPNDQRQSWVTLMTELRYNAGQNTESFARFRPESIAAWPIDLMFVDRATFEKIKGSSSLFEFGAIEAPVASIPHLIALKLHALKQGQEHREAKDISDILFLARRLPMTTEELRQLCSSHGTEAIFRKLQKVLSRE